MQFGVFEILGIIAAAQLLLLALYLITQKTGRRLRHRILAAFLFTGAMIIADLLHLRLALHLKFPYFVLSGFSLILVQGPLLYFFTKAATDRLFTLRKVHLSHLLPFALFWTLLVIGYHSKTLEFKLEILTSGEGGYREKFEILYYFLHMQVIAYLIAAIRSLYRFRRAHRAPVEQLGLNWLAFGLSVFLIMWVADLALRLVDRLTPLPVSIYGGFRFLCMAMYFVFANLAVFKSLKQPELILGENPANDKLKYENSTLTGQDSERIVQELLEYMGTREPHLNASLSLDKLANALHISSRHLSQVINEKLNQHFFDFINRYRIDEAKRLISDPSNNKTTILAILYEVGFNSKSAFNAAFKKHAGMTPREFKRAVQNQE